MRRMLLIESAVQGVLCVNGQFCGPMEREGQAFALGRTAEVYIQLFPLGAAAPLTAVMEFRNGQLARLEPQENCFALIWPDGIVQLELRLGDGTDTTWEKESEVMENVLLRYLQLRLAGDSRAQQLWLRAQDEAAAPDLSAYSAAAALRFAPLNVPGHFDVYAGLVRPVLPNAAVIDAALAITSPAGQGRRLIERMEIAQTSLI